MLLDGLTVEDINGGRDGERTPPPKSKIRKRKREEEKEEEKEEEEKETEAAKRIRRGGEGRERGRGARWRTGRHIENVSVTITSLVLYNTVIFTIWIFNADIEQADNNY